MSNKQKKKQDKKGRKTKKNIGPEETEEMMICSGNVFIHSKQTRKEDQ